MSDERPDETEPTEAETTAEPRDDASPFELPAIEGIPFSKDSDEARAIREVIKEADSERAGRD